MNKMKYFSICLVVVTIISVESTPLMNSKSNELNEDDSELTFDMSKREVKLTKLTDTAHKIRGEAEKKMRQMRQNTMKLIDSGSDALKDVLKDTNDNIQDTIDPVRNALKSNLKAVDKLGKLFLNVITNVPKFGVRTIKNYYKSSSTEVEGFYD